MILVEVGIVEAFDTAVAQGIADYSGIAEDTVVVDFHSLIDSFQRFVHIQNYWCFEVGNFLLRPELVHLLVLERNHVLHDLFDHLVLLDC